MTPTAEALPGLSIIVLPSDDASWAREAVRGVLAQDHPRVQVVRFGPAGAGGAAPESGVLTLPPADGRPPGELLNEAVRACSEELIGWLGEGDCYRGDSLWTVSRAAAAHPGFGLYVGNGLWHDPGAGGLEPFNPRHVALNRRALGAGADYILQPAAFVRRTAWRDVGGADPALRDAFDWDLFRRVAARFPAVLINEFLAVRPRRGDDRLRGKTLGRALEIARLARPRPAEVLPPSLCHGLLTGIADAARNTRLDPVAGRLGQALEALHGPRAEQVSHADGFPVEGDPQDVTYLAVASPGVPRRPDFPAGGAGPSFSIITPSFNQARFLPQALDSVLAQGYPRLETIVIDGGSTDGTRAVLERYGGRLTSWSSKPDRGPADAINQGLARSTGEVVSWLASDDMLAVGAVWEAARLFAADPELDLVYGNALYIDENNDLFLADHGHRTGLYYGRMQPPDRVPAYWSYVHAVPQPTVFFRRRLLERCGALDESYQFIFDFELFWRFARTAKVAKLERTQAFYRIHGGSKTSDWDNFLAELYRFSRPLWPGRLSGAFRSWWRDYVKNYMRRRCGAGPRGWRFWAKASLVALSALTGVGNPEAFGRPPRARGKAEEPSPPLPGARPPGAAEPFPAPAYRVERAGAAWHSIFCSLAWPRHPGYCGGEIRDFHLLRRLLSCSRVTSFCLDDGAATGRDDALGPYLEARHTPARVEATRPHLLELGAGPRAPHKRLVARLQKAGWPVPGARYHAEAETWALAMRSLLRGALQEALDRGAPDFVVVSPQVNPVGLLLDRVGPKTRLVLASYDVEAVRLARLAGARPGRLARAAGRLEAARARRFERDNLAAYDGVIAVSELDKELFVSLYGYPPERVLVVPNGVDPEYFAFRERPGGGGPVVVYTGSLNYAPNHQAALRLTDRIMPRVRRQHPGAVLWVVGQFPLPELIARHDGRQTVVTGRVPDVRPYLAGADAACVPLLAGSGTKYKVLEALSSGVPVVCSPLAAEGLDLTPGEHLLIGESDEELAAGLLRLLADRGLAARLARAGRRQVEEVYSWDQNLSALDGWLTLLADLPRYGAPVAARPRLAREAKRAA